MSMSVQSSVVTLAAIEQPPRPAQAHWKPVVCCPSCRSELCVASAALPDLYYVFGSERIAYPEQGITVSCCGSCGLFYKSLLPAPSFLSEVFKRQGAAKWPDSHDFEAEAVLLQRLMGGSRFDLLDVGAAMGGLLAACSHRGIRGRRSALDVIRYPGIERHLSGELIEGFLDDPAMTWSGEPYDIVTLFDVLEHLYDPVTAFENLRQLLRPGGKVLIETGNAMSFWPRRIGISEWWYVRLLEHHLFWSRDSVERAADAHGFRVIHWRTVRHKSRRRLLPRGAVVDSLKSALYLATNRHYASAARLLGRQGVQPWFPFGEDHFQACLEKV
jgi:SAM-dependent methyltransferase